MPWIFNVAHRDDLQQAPLFSSSISLRVAEVSGTGEFIQPLIEGMRDKVHHVKGAGESAASSAANDSRRQNFPETSIRKNLEGP
ncbi:MAG TPA: hypothetical protein VF827_04875, partial [Syntrophales bacterium]